MHFNFPKDRYEEGLARQVYAADGWWPWFGSLSASWFLDTQRGGTKNSNSWPTTESNMVAWRHGPRFASDALFLDGHVAPIYPRQVTDFQELYAKSVDTIKSFSWLPAEHTGRSCDSAYVMADWSIPEYRNRLPNHVTERDVKPGDQKGGVKWIGQNMPGNDNYHPYNFPDELSALWRTQRNAWTKLPSNPNSRK
jgi:prepilin-type processing-associated H-X9-DG protein